MKKTIFLTGSKGFIGKHLLPELHEYDVHCGGYNEVPTWLPDYIIHLAATTTTSDSFIPELFENNIIYAQKIMSIPTRIVYASSTSAAELTNPYAYTKQYIEHLGGLCNSTGLRFFNVYGMGNNKGLVKKAIDCIASGKEMYVSNSIRDYIHIRDVVAIIKESLFFKEKIVEVGTGTGTSTAYVLDMICKVFNGSLKIHAIDRPKTDMAISIASPGILGCLSFEDGLKKML